MLAARFLTASTAAVLFAVLPACAAPKGAAPQRQLTLTPEAAARIGRIIWKSECGGTVSGLTSWNKGEDFPSLGIGHFIWYPAGRTGPFEESFPGLVAFLRENGATLPAWLAAAPPCPWATRDAFLADLAGERLAGLRGLLESTVDLQTRYMARRAVRALPKLLAVAPAAQRAALEEKYFAVGATPQGVYALMDYVNFKGEGASPAERYQGQGWGLLQVLQEMQSGKKGAAAATEFSAAAKRVLARRIALAPRKEDQWRAGWFNRCESYGRPL